ncbi:MAG: hypothetical protein H0X73_01710 [Chthoniobacterales bacterium]|nr:hypothetical protein [Chthoniobacterales bacterium]
MQEFAHRLLHQTVFPQTYQTIKRRSASRARRRERERQTHLEGVLAQTFEKPVRLVLEEDAVPVVTENSRQITVGLPAPETSTQKKPTGN